MGTPNEWLNELNERIIMDAFRPLPPPPTRRHFDSPLHFQSGRRLQRETRRSTNIPRSSKRLQTATFTSIAKLEVFSVYIGVLRRSLLSTFGAFSYGLCDHNEYEEQLPTHIIRCSVLYTSSGLPKPSKGLTQSTKNISR